MRIFFTLLFLLNIAPIFACSCLGDTTFCSTITRDQGYFEEYPDFPDIKPALLVKGVKIEDYYHGMRFKILEVIRGEEEREEIMIWGDNGILCRQYTGGYRNTDTVIMALHRTDLSGNTLGGSEKNDLEKKEDYHISTCGVYSLFIENGKVMGPVESPEDLIMNYDDFLSLPCLNLISNIDNPIPDNTVIYPNPTNDNLYIKNSDFQLNPSLIIEVFDAQGRKVKIDWTVQGPQTIQISNKDLPAGIYFLVLQQEGMIRTERFLVIKN